MNKILFKYNPKKHTRESEFLPGVPLRDLTQDDIERIPLHLVETIKDTPYYEPATPSSKARAKVKDGE